jgi:nuclear pore complex protein Nup93
VSLDIFPLQAKGSASVIRSYATKFAALAQPISTCVPNLVMWTIECCNRQRDSLSSYQLGGTDGVRQQVLDEMKQAKLDLISYTSLLRYRFPNYVNEALARAQSE